MKLLSGLIFLCSAASITAQWMYNPFFRLPSFGSSFNNHPNNQPTSAETKYPFGYPYWRYGPWFYPPFYSPEDVFDYHNKFLQDIANSDSKYGSVAGSVSQLQTSMGNINGKPIKPHGGGFSSFIYHNSNMDKPIANTQYFTIDENGMKPISSIKEMKPDMSNEVVDFSPIVAEEKENPEKFSPELPKDLPVLPTKLTVPPEKKEPPVEDFDIRFGSLDQ